MPLILAKSSVKYPLINELMCPRGEPRRLVAYCFLLGVFLCYLSLRRGAKGDLISVPWRLVLVDALKCFPSVGTYAPEEIA
jgi:hypothetical protein